MPSTRQSRRAEAARQLIRQRLIDLAHRETTGPLGRYALADTRAALAAAAHCLSRRRGPFVSARWGETPVAAAEAIGLLRAADAELAALSPPPLPSGRRRRHELREIPEHYGYYAEKSRT